MARSSLVISVMFPGGIAFDQAATRPIRRMLRWMFSGASSKMPFGAVTIPAVFVPAEIPLPLTARAQVDAGTVGSDIDALGRSRDDSREGGGQDGAGEQGLHGTLLRALGSQHSLATIVPDSYFKVGGRLLIRLNSPSRPGSM